MNNAARAATPGALTFADTHAVNQHEHDLLLYWYGIHCKHRKEFGAEPLPYDEFYAQDGQRLLLDYYRELFATAAPGSGR